MNVGSYHQQQQQLLQFNFHQHQPSLPIGTNEADGKMSNNMPNTMGPPANSAMPPVLPNVDQITQNVNKMSVQERFAHSQVPAQITDQNKNLANADVYNLQKSSNLLNSAPAPNAYEWNTSINANAYANNNISSSESSQFIYNESSQGVPNSSARGSSNMSFTPSQNIPFSSSQNDAFSSTPQSNSFAPVKSSISQADVLPPKTFSPVAGQNNSFSAPVSQTNSLNTGQQANSFAYSDNNPFSPANENPFKTPYNRLSGPPEARSAQPATQPLARPVSRQNNANASSPSVFPPNDFAPSAARVKSSAPPPTSLINSFSSQNSASSSSVPHNNAYPASASGKNFSPPLVNQGNTFPLSQTKPFSPINSSEATSFPPSASTPGSANLLPATQNDPAPSSNSEAASFPASNPTVGLLPSTTQANSFPPVNSSEITFLPSTSTPASFPQANSFPGAQNNAAPLPTSASGKSAFGSFPPPTPQANSFAPPQPNSSFPNQAKPFPPPANAYPSQPNMVSPQYQNKSFPPPVSQPSSFPPPPSKTGPFPPQLSAFPPSSQNSYLPPLKSNSSYPSPPQPQSHQYPQPMSQELPPSAYSRPGYDLKGNYPPMSQNSGPMPGTNFNSNSLPGQSPAQYNQKSAFSPPYPYKHPGGGPNQAEVMGQSAGAYDNPYGSYSQQQEQQRRLDPDHIPNPIQVMKEDQELRGNEPFITNQSGLVPPMVSTNFVVEDEGNANPRFIRSTMYYVPCQADSIKQSEVPFSLVITPLATLHPDEQLPPIVNTGDFGPVRCVRCKGYMNPHMKFVDGGRRFVCVLCKGVTEVPPEYFQYLDHTGLRVDRYERPELLYGAYEFTVTKEYCKDSEIPNVPALIFIIDVSYNNMKSGMVKLLCEQMADIVQNYMPTDDGREESARMRVGFITYDSTIHFYNIKASLGQPQMMIVSDMEDVFVPILDGFLCDPIEALPVINSLMQQIPETFADTRETDTILLPAIQAGLEALKAAKCAGKLLIFNSSLPSANVPGKLNNREDRKLLGTDKEKTQLTPQNSAYASLAQECVGVGCSVDLFIFNNAYTDLATIGQISKLTGGEIFKYTYFQADIDGDRFITDVKRDTSKNIAFDAVMRVRTSAGVRPVNFYGHIFMSNTTDIELASINADKAIAVEIKHDEKLSEEEGVFIQVALLYTSCAGQRRVRILNLALKSCIQMADMFRQCELDTIINYLAKSAVSKLAEATPRQVKEGLTNKCARILACYRKLCASPCSPGQLILPECMKLLPLYLSCLLKSDALSGGSDMTVDDRWYMMQHVLIIDIPSSLNYFYPRMLPLVNIDYYSDELPSAVRCTSYRLSNSEAYLLENGVYMFLWLGSQIPAEWLINVFGVQDPGQIALNVCKIPSLDNVHSKKINSVIKRIQEERRHTMKLTIVRESDKMEIVFKHFLVEDGTGSAIIGDNLSTSSYVDFLCHMHKEIRSMLS